MHSSRLFRALWRSQCRSFSPSLQPFVNTASSSSHFRFRRLSSSIHDEAAESSQQLEGTGTEDTVLSSSTSSSPPPSDSDSFSSLSSAGASDGAVTTVEDEDVEDVTPPSTGYKKTLDLQTFGYPFGHRKRGLRKRIGSKYYRPSPLSKEWAKIHQFLKEQRCEDFLATDAPKTINEWAGLHKEARKDVIRENRLAKLAAVDNVTGQQ